MSAAEFDPDGGVSNERSLFGGASAVLAAVAVLAVAGDAIIVGVLGALAIPTAWYLAAPTYAFALGHLALVAVVPEVTTALAPVAVVELGLLGVLLASARTLDDADRPDALAAVGASLVVGWVLLGVGLAWASVQSLLWLPTAGVLLVGVTALAAYALRRYRLVALEEGGESRE